MDFFIARSMQIAGMEITQINDLHDIERKRGYCLPNWNIQTIFHLPTIKDRWMVPEDGMVAHAQRLRGDLLSQQIARDDSFMGVNNDGQEMKIVLRPWEALTTGRVEAVHAFDASVFDAVQEGRLSFAYAGGASSGTRLRDRVGAGRRSVDRSFGD